MELAIIYKWKKRPVSFDSLQKSISSYLGRQNWGPVFSVKKLENTNSALLFMLKMVSVPLIFIAFYRIRKDREKSERKFKGQRPGVWWKIMKCLSFLQNFVIKGPSLLERNYRVPCLQHRHHPVMPLQPQPLCLWPTQLRLQILWSPSGCRNKQKKNTYISMITLHIAHITNQQNK